MWQRRQRGDERLLGIDARRVRPGRGDDVRARARRNHRAAVERPLVRAAVLALGEVARAVAAPADRGGVGAHASTRASRSAIPTRSMNKTERNAARTVRPRSRSRIAGEHSMTRSFRSRCEIAVAVARNPRSTATAPMPQLRRSDRPAQNCQCAERHRHHEVANGAEPSSQRYVVVLLPRVLELLVRAACAGPSPPAAASSAA